MLHNYDATVPMTNYYKRQLPEFDIRVLSEILELDRRFPHEDGFTDLELVRVIDRYFEHLSYEYQNNPSPLKRWQISGALQACAVIAEMVGDNTYMRKKVREKRKNK